jgi:hypothetical protein
VVSRLAGPPPAPADWGVFRKPSDVASKKLSNISVAFGLRSVFGKGLIIEHGAGDRLLANRLAGQLPYSSEEIAF